MGVGVDTLRVFYALLLGGGALLALALGLGGQRAGGAWRVPLGPVALIVGMTCFGGAGILALHLFAFGPGWSALAAALFALLSAGLFGLMATLARQIAARRAALADLIGGLAAVSVAIEPGRAGVVTTARTHPPLILAAISRHDRPLPVGATVVVVALRNGPHGELVEVAPLPPWDGMADAAG